MYLGRRPIPPGKNTLSRYGSRRQIHPQTNLGAKRIKDDLLLMDVVSEYDIFQVKRRCALRFPRNPLNRGKSQRTPRTGNRSERQQIISGVGRSEQVTFSYCLSSRDTLVMDILVHFCGRGASFGKVARGHGATINGCIYTPKSRVL